MQDILDIFKIGSALYPTGTVIVSLIGGLLIVLSVHLSYQLRSNIIISGLTFLGANIISLFLLILFSASALNIQNYVLLKEAHGITIEEFITLEKNALEKKEMEIANQNSKAERLKRAEEKYNLSFDD